MTSGLDPVSPPATDSELVKVAYAQDEAEAELLQGLLRTADVASVVRRAPGFDVPEYLSAGPREVLVARSDLSAARSVLHEVDPDDSGTATATPPGDGRRPRVVAALLIPVALVVAVVCVAADVV